MRESMFSLPVFKWFVEYMTKLPVQRVTLYFISCLVSHSDQAMKSPLLPCDLVLEITMPRQFIKWDLVNPLLMNLVRRFCKGRKLLSHVVIAGRPGITQARKALGADRDHGKYLHTILI